MNNNILINNLKIDKKNHSTNLMMRCIKYGQKLLQSIRTLNNIKLTKQPTKHQLNARL